MTENSVSNQRTAGYRALSLLLAAYLLSGFSGSDAGAQVGANGLGGSELYVSVELTLAGGFATGLDGIGCDREGNLYAANYSCPGAICQVTPGGETHEFASLPDGNPGSGMQYQTGGFLLVADPRYNRILQVDTRTRQVREYARGLASLMMNSPENIAVAANGFAYVTDPDREAQSGQLWGIDADGAAFRMEADMGTVNGIALSPDDRVLYVSESVQGNVWAYDLSAEGEISGKRLLAQFADGQPDDMAVDVAGDLYIAFQGRGTVVKVSPEGEVLEEVALAGMQPTAIALGGEDGRTCFVALADRGNIEGFRVERPGVGWQAFALQGEAPTQVAPASWGEVKLEMH